MKHSSLRARGTFLLCVLPGWSCAGTLLTKGEVRLIVSDENRTVPAPRVLLLLLCSFMLYPSLIARQVGGEGAAPSAEVPGMPAAASTVVLHSCSDLASTAFPSAIALSRSGWGRVR